MIVTARAPAIRSRSVYRYHDPRYRVVAIDSLAKTELALDPTNLAAPPDRLSLAG